MGAEGGSSRGRKAPSCLHPREEVKFRSRGKATDLVNGIFWRPQAGHGGEDWEFHGKALAWTILVEL